MTVVNSSDVSDATGYGNQRKVCRTSNGILWAVAQITSTSHQFEYSSDGGTTWTPSSSTFYSGTVAHSPNLSFFIDQDDYGHFVEKNPIDGHIYYRRLTPNAARTSWTWSAALQVRADTTANYPDVIAHREGTGWVAHIIWGENNSAPSNFALYNKVTITSAGGQTLGSVAAIGGNYSANVNPFPSIDFNHTGDGKTVAGSTPHLYVSWSAGATGAGKGIRFKKATYSGGAWTWGTEQEIDPNRFVNSSGTWSCCLFDGVRVMIGGYYIDAGAGQAVALYERNAADTSTTTQISPALNLVITHGSLSWDYEGNIWMLGRDVDGTSTSRLYALVWDRASLSNSKFSLTIVDSSAPYVSMKRGDSYGRLEYIYTENTAAPYEVNFLTYVINDPPNAPTSLAPDGTVIDRNIINRFSWTFSDTEPGDTQSAYDLRYREAGLVEWTVVSGGAVSYHDFGVGHFTVGDWEWQVRTTDNGGLVGPYSSTAFFTAGETPSDLAISDPFNGQTITVADYTVRWTASTQDQYQVRRVADDGAGNPDTATIYEDTGQVSSTSARSRTMSFPVQGRDEHVQVRIAKNTLWSAWESVRVSISYNPPAAPSFTLTPNQVDGSVFIDITNPLPSGDEPTVDTNEVWSRLVATETYTDGQRPIGGDGIRIASGIANGGTYTDYGLAWGKAYEYRVRAIGATGTSTYSAWQ